MRALGVGLLLLSVVLAGCTSPAPPATDAPPGQPSFGDAHRVEPVQPAPDAPADDAPSHAAPSAAPPDAPPAPARAPPPAPSPAPEPTAAPQPAEAPPAPPPAQDDAPTTPPPPPGPAAPTFDAPRWKVGDVWRFRGTNDTGASYSELVTVVAERVVAGVPSYETSVVYANGTNATRGGLLNFTKDGVNLVNSTGYVTELLRFPMTAGMNWSFGFERREVVLDAAGESGWLYQKLHVDVRVLRLEALTTEAGTFEAYHLQAHIEAQLDRTTTWQDLDYWYAPEARSMVRMVAVSPHGTDTSELAEARPQG